MNHLALGKAGEEKAKKFLEGKGYRVIARNFRCKSGEIDLICRFGDALVFVEVKTRQSLSFGDGAEAVDSRKIQKIFRAAQYFMKINRMENLPIRFDVISILSKPQEKITHIEEVIP